MVTVCPSSRAASKLTGDVSRRSVLKGAAAVASLVPAAATAPLARAQGKTIKLAFVTVARFKQTADDLWRDGVLVRSRARTEDDGDITTLEDESSVEEAHHAWNEIRAGIATGAGPAGRSPA